MNRSRYDHEILHTYGGQPAPQTCWKLRHQQLPVGCKMLLKTARKCAKRVRPDEELNNPPTV